MGIFTCQEYFVPKIHTRDRVLKPNMTNDVKIKDGHSVYSKPLSGDPLVGEHDMDSDSTTSINHVKLTCPQCGKLTLRAEIPDTYEAWITCSSCNFFMGMSNDDWHRIT